MNSIKQAYRAVDNFFFARTSPANLAVFRIVLGLSILATAVLMAPNLQALFGPDGVVSVSTVKGWYGTPHFSLLNQFPSSAEAVTLCWLALVWSSVALIFGWHTRTCAMLVVLLLASFHHRNPFVFQSGDSLLRLFSFLLIFSAAGSMYSIDASDRNDAEPPRVPIWPQRLIQLQCIIQLKEFVIAPEFGCVAMAAFLSFVDGKHIEEFVNSLKAKLHIFSYQTGPSLASTTSSAASSPVEPPTRSKTRM